MICLLGFGTQPVFFKIQAGQFKMFFNQLQLCRIGGQFLFADKRAIPFRISLRSRPIPAVDVFLSMPHSYPAYSAPPPRRARNDVRLHHRAPSLDRLLLSLGLPPALVQFLLFHHDFLVRHFRVHLYTCLSYF